MFCHTKYTVCINSMHTSRVKEKARLREAAGIHVAHQYTTGKLPLLSSSFTLVHCIPLNVR